MDADRPDYWEKWRLVEYVDLNKAACLLSGVDPLRVTWDDFEKCLEMQALLKQALISGRIRPFRLVERFYTAHGAQLRPIEKIPEDTTDKTIANETEILVDDLAAWADRKGIPHHWPHAETANKLAEIEASPFSARERNNMLRIVRALSEMAGLQERGGTASIECQLQVLGFTSPKEDTIRRVLKEARELEPDENPN